MPKFNLSRNVNALRRRVKSPIEKDSLGAQEDASKQGRIIKEIDQNAEIALDAKTQGTTNDDEIFGVDYLAGEEVVMETTTSVKDSAAPITYVTEDEVTMAQALAALKSTKPKVVVQEQEMSTTITAATTIVTTAIPTPRAKGIVFHKQKQSQIPTISSSKNKGKAKMIEPEVPIKRKEQMRIDEEYARKLKAEEQEAARLSRAQQDEEANNSWDNMQAMMDVDRLLAERLQARAREEFSEVQKARLEMKKVNDFIAMNSDAQESNTKRTAEHLESDISKKQKVDEIVKPVIDDSKELKKCMEIVHDDGDEIIRADGNSQVYQTFEKMFKNFNREDLEVLWAIVKDRFKKEKPVDDMDNLLFRTLKTMFEHHVKYTIWKYQQGLAKFWSTTMAKTINGKVQIYARVDDKEIVINESFVRRDLQLSDEEARVESSNHEESLGKDASKQERRIDVIDVDDEITLLMMLIMRSLMWMILMVRRCLLQNKKLEKKKALTAKRAEEKRNKPPTKAQQRKIMCTYLKNMKGFKIKVLKLKGFDSIKEMFDHLKDEEEVPINAIPLAIKSLRIVDWKIHKEGKKSYYQIMRIEQYFLMTDYSLREVILNGDSPVSTRVVEDVLQPVAPTTAEQKLARKNELKAR
nr:hypothetical protein [Tanacetum cinerariifolium]